MVASPDLLERLAERNCLWLQGNAGMGKTVLRRTSPSASSLARSCRACSRPTVASALCRSFVALQEFAAIGPDGPERDRVPYDVWARQGLIEPTPGNVVDYGAVEARVRADAALFDVREIAYDAWNATHIALRLQEEGASMVEFRQGFRSWRPRPVSSRS